MSYYKKCLFDVLSIVMALICAITFTVIDVKSEENEKRTWCIPQFDYADIGNGEIEITGMGEISASKIIIPQTIDGKTVTKIKNVRTAQCHTINTVVLPDTVTEIKDEAFRNYMSMAHIVFSPNLKIIGANAFTSSNEENYNALDTTEGIPFSICELGERAFYATNIKKAEFGPKLKSISKEAFLNCYKLEKIKINDGTGFIKSKAFANTKVLSDVTILDNNIIIADDAFEICPQDLIGSGFENREKPIVFKAISGSSTEKFVNKKISEGVNYEFEPLDFSYRIIDDETIAVTGTSLTGEITVPQTIDQYKVVSIEGGAFGKSVTKVNVHDDVKIADNALLNAYASVQILKTNNIDANIDIGSVSVNEPNDLIFGMGHPLLSEYSGGRLLLDRNGDENVSFYENSKENTFPLIRLGAMEANLYDWKSAIGSYEDRPITMISRDGYYDKIHTGLDDIIKGFTKADKNVAFSYTVNLWDDGTKTADLAEYLLGDGNKNINGGENLADKRIKNGIKNPVNIVIWELGNEVDLKISGKNDGDSPYDASRLKLLSVDEYAEKCITAMKAILSVDPDAVFAVHDLTGYVNGGMSPKGEEHKWRAALFEKLNDYREHIKYFVMHRYYNDAVPSHSISNIVDTHINNTIADLDSILGEGHGLKIYFSEHSFHYVNADNLNNGAQEIYEMETILNVSNFYNRVLPRKDVGAASFFSSAFSLTNKWQWAAYYDINGETKPGAVIDLMQLYKNYGAGDVLQVKITDKENNTIYDVGTDSQISASAVKTQNGIDLFLTNLSETDAYNICLPSTKSYSLLKEHILAGKTLKSANYKNKNEISLKDITFGPLKRIIKYCVPPASVVVLELKENSGEFFLPSVEVLTEKNEEVRSMSDLSDQDKIFLKLNAGEYTGKNKNVLVILAKYKDEALTELSSIELTAEMIKNGYNKTYDVSKQNMFDRIGIFVINKESLAPFTEKYEIK